VLDAGMRHSLTEPSVVVYCGIPNPTNTIAKNTPASSRFITGPPSMMTIFFQTGSR